MERRVRLIRRDGAQTLSIPPEFELPGEEAVIRKEDGRLSIEPARPGSLRAVLASLAPLDEEFPPISELPHERIEF